MKRTKLELVLIASILLVAIIVPIHSAYVTHEIPSGVLVVSSVVRAYWDPACTQLVTQIDLGEIHQGSQDVEAPDLYLKNEGTGAVHVYWTSTLSLATDRMYDQWYDWTQSQNLNNSLFAAGAIHTTGYRIHVYIDAPVGMYNWTLNIGVLET